MKVYVAIIPGNFGDLESFGGVFASPEAAIKEYPGTYRAGVYTSGGFYLVRTDKPVEVDEDGEFERQDFDYLGRDNVVIREVEVQEG
jgi:hypothetical protein